MASDHEEGLWAPSVRVVGGSDAGQDVTVVFLRGDHDYASRDDVARALGPLRGHVMIDFSGCTFFDSSIIAVVLAKRAALVRCGGRLELIVPPQRTNIRRRFDQLGIRGLVPLLAAPPGCLAPP